MISKLKSKSAKIILGGLLLLALLFLFNGFKSEMEITSVKRRYDAYSFPEYITYTINKGLVRYRGDLKFNPDSVKMDKNIYYGEYFGTVKKDGYTFLK
ncbi:MAG: hypothetical protein E6312_04935 [Peptoniphilus grossensis]|uniref:hypothetical protein n=1 Tax=Peptoniphilus grossensis TaxID=1465756 RepID=UPI002906F5A9|nr:hypothetical protein [Peptoniphilus grossensis]MDU7151407.1 hypothetical protein [Peptoniphilus grossensis]